MRFPTNVPPEAAERIRDAFATLMEIRHLRVSTQHNDAGHKTIEAFSHLVVTFPVASWEYALAQVTGQAIDALEQIRQEVRAREVR
jgi:hypothetical protein